jgi:hypothetical protein
MTSFRIPATCACAQPTSASPCTAPARSIYEMLSESEHTADTISALASSAELMIEVVENASTGDTAVQLADTRKLLRLIRSQALALAEVISDVELACRPLTTN